MKPTTLSVVQHHAAEGPGELAVWAEARGLRLNVHRADLDALPAITADPVLLLGGPYPLQGGPEWLQRERRWLRQRLAAGAPVFGICLGAQLLAEALGGEVFMLPESEEGWTRVDFDDGAQMDVLQWHDDSFTLPPAATLHARSKRGTHQYFTHGECSVGVQFHPEWNAASVQALNDHFGASSPLPRADDDDAAKHFAVAAWFHNRLDRWRASMGWQ